MKQYTFKAYDQQFGMEAKVAVNCANGHYARKILKQHLLDLNREDLLGLMLSNEIKVENMPNVSTTNVRRYRS